LCLAHGDDVFEETVVKDKVEEEFEEEESGEITLCLVVPLEDVSLHSTCSACGQSAGHTR